MHLAARFCFLLLFSASCRCFHLIIALLVLLFVGTKNQTSNKRKKNPNGNQAISKRGTEVRRRRCVWIIRNRRPTFPSLYILLVSLVRAEFHSLGLGVSIAPFVALVSVEFHSLGLATVYINKVSA